MEKVYTYSLANGNIEVMEISKEKITGVLFLLSCENVWCIAATDENLLKEFLESDFSNYSKLSLNRAESNIIDFIVNKHKYKYLLDKAIFTGELNVVLEKNDNFVSGECYNFYYKNKLIYDCGVESLSNNLNKIKYNCINAILGKNKTILL